MRLLIADSDCTRVTELKNAFSREGIRCVTTGLGEEVISLTKSNDFDLVLLSPTLHDVDCYQVLRRLRSRNFTRPILLMVGQNVEAESIKAFEAGADDIFSPPFNSRAIALRLRAIIRRSRRSKGRTDNIVQIGPFAIDLTNLLARHGATQLKLAPSEMKVLELLCIHKDRIVAQESIYNHLYDGRDGPDPKVIPVFMSHLRKKLAAASGGERLIETVWGRGYILKTPGTNGAAVESNGAAVESKGGSDMSEPAHSSTSQLRGT